MTRKILFSMLAALALAGCTTGMSGEDSSPEQVAAAAYRHDGPPALTLYTMINNRNGAGAHTSLMVNAPSQRVIFDPAGSVRLNAVPEIGDVLYGITPEVEDFYARAHARETYHVRIQRVEVPAAVAEQALRLVQANGPVGSARCTLSTSAVLRQLPGFQSMPNTWFPNNLADAFSQVPNVSDRKLYEIDADDKAVAIAEFEAQKAAEAGE